MLFKYISYRSGSIILVYNFRFGATPDNDATTMHTTLTNIIESNREAVTAMVEMDEVEKVGVVLGMCCIQVGSVCHGVCIQVRSASMGVYTSRGDLDPGRGYALRGVCPTLSP